MQKLEKKTDCHLLGSSLLVIKPLNQYHKFAKSIGLSMINRMDEYLKQSITSTLRSIDCAPLGSKSWPLSRERKITFYSKLYDR